MRPVNNFIFIDEVENNLDGDPELYYFCLVVIERELDLIEHVVENAIAHLGKKGFHAKRDYKDRESSFILMRRMTDIIINNKIFCFSFSFKKSYLDDKRLLILKEFKPQEWNIDITKYWDVDLVRKITDVKNWEFDSSNYRQVASMLLFHCLNTYLGMKGFMKKYRLIFDEDVIRKNQIVIPREDKILSNLDTVYASSSKQAPVLCLSDHVSYIFGKYLRINQIVDGKIQDQKILPKIKLIKECISNSYDLINRGHFLYRSIWDWIKFENMKPSPSNNNRT